MNRIDMLRAPLLLSWQITRDCDLSCLHCCTGSAPGRRLPHELNAEEAFELAEQIIRNEIPYVMLCGGEPLVVPHFLALAEKLGHAGIWLKIETNGQLLDGALADRLARLPIRSVQISLDANTADIYARQRPGGSLHKAHAACRAVRAAGLPLEITFAPTRFNIHEVGSVIERARELGAFRFNTGQLMRIGTAARLWHKLEPSAEDYRQFRATLDECANRVGGELELCYTPFSIAEALAHSIEDPPATLLVLPDGRIKVTAALPHLCADLRRDSLTQAWHAYRCAWRNEDFLAAARCGVEDESAHAQANVWRPLQAAHA